MSCSQNLVRKFLEETYGILCEEDSFFKKTNIHILQCDETCLLYTSHKVDDKALVIITEAEKVAGKGFKHLT